MNLIRTGESFTMIADPIYKYVKPTLSWTQSVGATSYRLKISSTDASCSDTVQSYPSISDLSQTLSPLANGTYFACLEGTRGVRYFSATNTGLSFEVKAPVAVISNAPSGYNAATKLDVTISGGDFYKYKLVTTSTGCAEETGYSAERPTITKITDNIALKDTYAYSLCVVAKDPEGNWQDYAFASKASWNVFRLSFTGNSSPNASISDRMFRSTNGVSTVWNLIGLCDPALGSIALSGSGLNASSTVICKSDGTWSQEIYWGGSTSPYLWNYNGSTVLGAKVISISQLGAPTVLTKLYQAYADHVLVMVYSTNTLFELLNANISNTTYVIQAADIDLAGVVLTSTTATHYGVYEGNGFKLSNFSNSGVNRGLFKTISNGVVSNVTLDNIDISTLSSGYGGLVGSAGSLSVIFGVRVTGKLNCIHTYCGGIVGDLTSNSLLLRSGVNLNLTSSTNYAGPVAGLIQSGSILDGVYSMGSIVVSGSASGGVVGRLQTNTKLLNCYRSGSQIATGTGGGLVGGSNSFTEIANCHISSTVALGSGGDLAWGSGSFGTASNIYGLADASCTRSGGIPCNRADMTTLSASQWSAQSSFVGFDFLVNKIWKIAEGVSAPTFSWE